jgi:FkbM family methyltransferase
MMILEDSPDFLARKREVHKLICGRNIFVLGRNKFAALVAEQLNCAGFVDDTFEGGEWHRRPVCKLKDLHGDSVVVSCVVAGRPLTAIDRCRSLGIVKVIDYFSLCRYFPEQFPAVEFCEDNRNNILANRQAYEAVYNSLADDVSRTTFEKICRFRFTMDLENMRGFEFAMHRQYIEAFLSRDTTDVFVDGGGFDGQTTRQFVDWKPDFSKVYYFEPIPTQMEQSRRRLSDVRDVAYFQKALFRDCRTLRFSANGAGSTVSANGETIVEAVSLDSVTDERIGFVKLDIEGGEIDAIIGSTRIISTHHPTLAVCIYHRPSDFYNVPRIVAGIYPHYRLYVRHYTEGVNETVMFFVP